MVAPPDMTSILDRYIGKIRYNWPGWQGIKWLCKKIYFDINVR